MLTPMGRDGGTGPRAAVETTLYPPPPYSLRRSAPGPPCPTRRFRDGVLELVFDTSGGPARALVRQRPDGALAVRVEGGDPDDAVARVRFLLAADLDLGPFLARVADDPLLGPAVRRHRGMRPLRLGSVAHALLRGVTGQLVRVVDARRAEAQAARQVARGHAGLHLAVTAAELRCLTVPGLRACGVAERRARALVRAAREVDLGRLAGLDAADVVRRLAAVPGIGPWTAGVVCLAGLGRTDHGLVGDLGLVKVLAAATGRVPDEAETARLLDRWAPFQGLASVYLVRSAAAARIPATAPQIAHAVRGLGIA
ncbi:MAG: hypothetical protein AB1416_06965 [Actinomycetota bacterium]